MITARDLRLIAGIIADLDLQLSTRVKIAEAFAKKLAPNNPNFSSALFFSACKVLNSNEPITE